MQQKKRGNNKHPNYTRIHLKPVGKLLTQVKKQRISRKSCFQPTREQDRYDDQIIPKSIKDGDSQEKTFFKVHSSKKINYHTQIKFNLIEDPRESDFSYRKYILLEKILLILSIFYFAIAVIDAQMYILDQNAVIPSDWDTSLNVDIVCSIFTLLLSNYTFIVVLTILLRYVYQKKFYCIRTGNGIFHQIVRFFQNSNNLKKFLLQVCLLLPHPFFYFHQTQIQLFQSYTQIYLNHRVNDILILISIFRVYIIMRSMINLTMYSTPRASRLCSHNRIQHSFLYSVKCLLKQQPVKIICLVFLIQQIALGLGLKLSEGTLIYINPQLSAPTGFQNYINCYWCIFITMATVGYGDYYPKTTPGRIVGLISAISGIILSSLLIVSLSAYLTMQGNESKSHLTLIRLQQQHKLKQQASQALIATLKMTKLMQSEDKETDGKIKKFFIALKHKIDLVKFRTRKIKSLVNNNNIIEQMNRLFQLFKDSLQQSFRCQVQLKQSLQKLTNNSPAQRKMQTLFMTNNMEQIITNKL